jgi:hypothetical protein
MRTTGLTGYGSWAAEGRERRAVRAAERLAPGFDPVRGRLAGRQFIEAVRASGRNDSPWTKVATP